MDTRTRLANLIRADVEAGMKVQWLEINGDDRAGLIADVRRGGGPVAKKMKADGIGIAVPTIGGVELRWDAAQTRTVVKAKTKQRPVVKHGA